MLSLERSPLEQASPNTILFFSSEMSSLLLREENYLLRKDRVSRSRGKVVMLRRNRYFFSATLLDYYRRLFSTRLEKYVFLINFLLLYCIP